MEGHILQGNPVHSGIGYSTLKEAKLECSKGKISLYNYYLNFTTSHCNNGFSKYFKYSIFSYSGRACRGITFENDTKKWTPKRGTDLIVSANPEDKSILRSCYGKQILRNKYISWRIT